MFEERNYLRYVSITYQEKGQSPKDVNKWKQLRMGSFN